MSDHKPTNTPAPHGPEGVPVDAPDNSAPAISPHAVSRMHRTEDDDRARKHSPEFSDDRTATVDDRVSGEAWIPGKSGERGPRDHHDERRNER